MRKLHNELFKAKQIITDSEQTFIDYQTDHATAIDYVAKCITNYNNHGHKRIDITYNEIFNMSLIELLHLYKEISK